MAGNITFGGLASGLDTNGIISALMSVERQPLTTLQSRQSKVDQAKTTVSTFQTKMISLQSAAKALSDPTGFAAYSATSSDSSIVVSANASAAPGSYDVKVVSLAKEQRTYSDAQTSDIDALGQSGSISLSIGSTSANIDVDSTDSLASIAAKINGAGLRASASVISTADGYKLQIRGLDTGAANKVTLTETGTSLGLTTPANTYQSAQDAEVQVDGNTIKRPTNSITGVIPGVSLALTKVPTDPVTVRVGTDPAALTAKIQSFVTAYNDVVSAGQSAIGYGSLKPTNSELAGDTAIRTSLDRVSALLPRPIAGTIGKYTSLASVGVSVSRDGKLSLDQSKLAAALVDDPSAVSKVFVTDAKTGATGVMKGFVDTISTIATNTDSVLTNRLDSFGRLQKQLTNDADALQRQLDATETALRARFTALETQMSQIKGQSSSLGSLTNSSSSNNS
jgi:flagellar hook-associated protein 2